MKQIDHHPAKSDEDSAVGSISDTENWLDWNGNLKHPTTSQDDSEADNGSEIELDNAVTIIETPELRNFGATPCVPG
jgi:hypothetical protein